MDENSKMNEFLKVEYEKCIDLLKFYDERHQSLVKYASGISAAVPSLLLSIYQIKGKAEEYFWDFSFIISLLAMFGLLSIFVTLVQTRLYFIYPTRQVNAIRKYSLEKLNDEQFKNQMYLSTAFSAFKLRSTQTTLNLFISMQVGSFAGLTLYIWMIMNNFQQNSVLMPVFFSILLVVILFCWSSYYLYKASKYHPDSSIHREGNTQ